MTAPIRYASNGDVKIAYEVFGDVATGEPILLIMGLDYQMVWWPDAFCEALVDKGLPSSGLTTATPASLPISNRPRCRTPDVP